LKFFFTEFNGGDEKEQKLLPFSLVKSRDLITFVMSYV